MTEYVGPVFPVYGHPRFRVKKPMFTKKKTLQKYQCGGHYGDGLVPYWFDIGEICPGDTVGPPCKCGRAYTIVRKGGEQYCWYCDPNTF